MRNTARGTLSRWMTPLWPATLLGILLGAALGGLALHSTSGTTGASALVRIDQPIDPNQIMTGTAPSTDSQQSYMSGEITYLTSPGFASAVGKELNETARPDISAVQSGQSSIITLSANAANFHEAQRTVDAALKTYDNHVQQQNRERGQAAIDALNGVIAGLEVQKQESATAADATQSDANGNPVETEQQRSQQARIDQLDQQRLAIQVQIQRAAGVQVVQPPTQTSTAGAPDWTLGAVGGGLLGGLLALTAALTVRRRAGAVMSPSSLDGHVERVLLPVVTLTAITGLGEPSAADTAAGRSIYAQLPPPRSGRILLVGASAESGSAEVARLLAFAAAEHEDVALVHLLDVDHQFSGLETIGGADMAGGRAGETTTIIDGGSLGASPALPDVAAHASQIIIVAMIGRDVNNSVRMASQLARTTDVPVSAVCTRRRAGSRQSRRGGKQQSKHAARHKTDSYPSALATSTSDHDEMDQVESTADDVA